MHPLARSSDPLTSFESAARVIEFKQSQEHQILRTLAIHGALGSSGIAAHCGLLPHEVGKRLIALQREGRIALTGQIVRASSGRNERVWIISGRADGCYFDSQGERDAALIDKNY